MVCANTVCPLNAEAARRTRYWKLAAAAAGPRPPACCANTSSSSSSACNRSNPQRNAPISYRAPQPDAIHREHRRRRPWRGELSVEPDVVRLSLCSFSPAAAAGGMRRLNMALRPLRCSLLGVRERRDTPDPVSSLSLESDHSDGMPVAARFFKADNLRARSSATCASVLVMLE